MERVSSNNLFLMTAILIFRISITARDQTYQAYIAHSTLTIFLEAE